VDDDVDDDGGNDDDDDDDDEMATYMLYRREEEPLITPLAILGVGGTIKNVLSSSGLRGAQGHHYAKQLATLQETKQSIT